MNRTAATAWLTEKFRELVTYANFTPQNTTDAYNAAIDMGLRQLGVGESALATYDVAQADVLKYIACLNYYALDRFATLLALQFDVKAGQGAIDAQRSQAFDRVNTLKAQAAQELGQYGINVGGIEAVAVIGRLPLDIYEPSTTGSEF